MDGLHGQILRRPHNFEITHFINLMKYVVRTTFGQMCCGKGMRRRLRDTSVECSKCGKTIEVGFKEVPAPAMGRRRLTITVGDDPKGMSSMPSLPADCEAKVKMLLEA